MSTSEERLKILKMVEEGKISVDDGARLLKALGDDHAAVESPSAVKHAGGARWLRIRVTDMDTGRAKATVNLPIGLIDAGMKIGARFAPEINDIDMTQILEAFKTGAAGKIIDVTDEEDGEHVEIFIE